MSEAEARADGDHDHSCETILNYVLSAHQLFQWTLDNEEFDVMISTEEESALGPGAGSIVSHILFDVYKQIVVSLLSLLATGQCSFLNLLRSMTMAVLWDLQMPYGELCQ